MLWDISSDWQRAECQCVSGKFGLEAKDTELGAEKIKRFGTKIEVIVQAEKSLTAIS